MKKQIQLSWHFNQSPEEVWEYLTQPELMEQWLMKSNFVPVVGHKFQFTFNPKPGSPYHGEVDCEVLEVMPITRLSYTWNGRMLDGSRSFNSVIVWTLVPQADGVSLQLEHDGFTVLEDIIAHTSGWNSCQARLDNSLNTVKK